jgi:RNA polymerase sigma factor (sigma-70 family)
VTPLFASRFALDPERSFERLYRKHVRDVYAFSLGILGNPDDAEDVTQTTFMNAYRALARGDGIDNPRAWLLKIAHNVCRQRFRTAARRPQEVELAQELADAFVEEEPPAADEIRAALRHLAFNQRTVLVLREIEGLSYAEIADTMGITPSAVETLLFRARRALREQLEASERPLGCPDAEGFISRQLDGRLSRNERGQLRAHLRACPGCAAYARSQRAQKKAMRTLAAVPLPLALAEALGSSLGGGVVAKAAAVAVGVAFVGGGVAVGTGVVTPFDEAAPRANTAAPVGAPAAGVGVADAADHALPTAASDRAEERSRRADAGERADERPRSSKRAEPARPAKAADPAKPAKAMDPAKAADNAKAADPANPAKPVRPPHPSQGEKVKDDSVDPIDPVAPATVQPPRRIPPAAQPKGPPAAASKGLTRAPGLPKAIEKTRKVSPPAASP